MTSTKESHSRSASHHRLSMTTMASSNLPLRQSNSRHHNHSVSMGSIGQTHRVTRRKSLSTNSGTNMAAVAAAVKDATNESAVTMPALSNRRSMTLKVNGASSKASETGPTGSATDLGNYPSPPSSLPNHAKGSDRASRAHAATENGSAIAEGPESPAADDINGVGTKNRIRRASEGSHLIKTDGKRMSGGELRCEKCGKGYKHSSCLTKHLWEHTPEWSYTSKLLISKHQQVQLLEAASVLVSMNLNPDTPPDSAKDLGSDNSTSPAASGSSEFRGERSSTDTTPPPQTDEQISAALMGKGTRSGRSSKRYSNGSSFSRSYQSAPSASMAPGSLPSGSADFGFGRPLSGEQRPLAGLTGQQQRDEEEAGLAAAVELLSCSFGTPQSRPVTLPADVPPVPPLPARFMGANASNLSGSTATPSSHRPTRGPQEGFFRSDSHYTPHDQEAKMTESEESAAEDDYYDQRSVSRGRSDEDDDGVFGRMEE